jgi:hypothetical protein
MMATLFGITTGVYKLLGIHQHLYATLDTQIEGGMFPNLHSKEKKKQDEVVSLNQNSTATLCLIVKDPQLYLEEWVDYHFALGFTGLHIFDNSPSFNLQDWGKDKSYAGRINVTHHVPKSMYDQQTTAYVECIREAASNNISWVADFDVDEFLVLRRHESVLSLMEDHCPWPCGQLSINWITFGSSNRTHYAPVPVTRRFYEHSGVHKIIKVSCNVIGQDSGSPF